MTPDEFQTRLASLIENYRARCLWSWPRSYYPRTDAAVLAVLDAIERGGDRAAFHEVAALRSWLLLTSRKESVA